MKPKKNARYLVGIDLGTTNSVMAYSEICEDLSQAEVKLFEIDQLVGPGEVARKPMLPSFRFHSANQFQTQDVQLPWQDSHLPQDDNQVIVGQWARDLGAQIEGRQVSSAKSWLSHHGVDRSQDILPWGANNNVLKVSPILASASYLHHMHQAWNYHHSDAPLNEQDVVITIPASFDESARSFTLEAAKLAGLDNIVLLEEPQAVCYDWYQRHQDSAAEKLQNIAQILICDVGGGTTDLSLIAASQDKENGLALNRVGVGDHLMLGGDNIDLALAHYAEQSLNKSKPMNAQALMKLINQTRQVKESLLRPDAPEQAKISILGSGSRLIGGTQSALIEKTALHKMVLDGFFPLTDQSQMPDQRAQAVVEFGLPYAHDAAISKHLAQFLSQHSPDKQVPEAVLFNGGIFNSDLIKARLIEILSQWRGAPVTLLENPNPDLAVAFGAVAYAKARRGAALKIGGGSARSYFLHLKQKNKSQALCLLAKGTEENQEIRLTGREFLLTLGEPVKIDILTSTQESFINAQHAKVSAQNSLLLDVSQNLEQAQFQPLPPYIATLAGEKNRDELAANQKERQRVMLACQLTEVGTLALECISLEDDSKRWQLEFDARNAQEMQQDEDLHPNLERAKALIATTFSANRKTDQKDQIKTLTKELEKMLGKRDTWDFALSRQLFDSFALGRKRRRRSNSHEQQWLRLAGFALRPGFGDAADSWRIEQIWSIYPQNLQFPSHQSWSDWWTFWRRISGGLTTEQQESILADIAKYLHPGAMRQKSSAKDANDHGYEAMVRLAASLEHLEVEDKALLVNWFLTRAQKQTDFVQAHWWAVARLAARTQMYASAHNVIDKNQVQTWLTKILELDWKAEPMIGFAAMMMSRKTGDRSLDIDESMRAQVIEKLKQSRSPQSWVNLVETVAQLDEKESKRLFGDSLPAGLSLA